MVKNSMATSDLHLFDATNFTASRQISDMLVQETDALLINCNGTGIKLSTCHDVPSELISIDNSKP